MKFFLITGLVALATLVFGLPAIHGNNFGSGNHSTKDLILQEAKSVISEIVKREEGTSAVVPDVPPALIASLGNTDCYLDCREDFPKAFVCWYYNNTRCNSCSLTSDDQSCRDLCVCRKVNQKWSDKIITRAQPVSLSSADDKEIVAITKPVRENNTQAKLLYCGSTELTKTCTLQGTACSGESIISDNDTCRKYCYCRNWNSTSSRRSEVDTIKQESDSVLQIYPFVCGSQDLTQECATNGTWCTTEGLTTDDEICRERCNCHYKSIITVGSNPVVSTRIEASIIGRDLSVRCIGRDLTALCIANDTTCRANGIETTSKKCFEYCWCQNDMSSNIYARHATPPELELAAGPWSCGSKTLDEGCALQNTFCTGHGVISDSEICRDRCFCHRLKTRIMADEQPIVAPGLLWCGSNPKTQYCRNEKTFCTADGLRGEVAECKENCECIMDTRVKTIPSVVTTRDGLQARSFTIDCGSSKFTTSCGKDGAFCDINGQFQADLPAVSGFCKYACQCVRNSE